MGQRIIRRRIVIHPSPLIHKNFPISESLWNTKGYPTKFSGLVRLKFSNGKSWYSLIMHKFFVCPILSKSLKKFPQTFWHCEMKTIDRIVIPLLSKKVWYQNTSETQNGSPTMIFGNVRQKNSTKLWYPYYPKMYWCQNISETQASPYKIFRYCETKKVAKIVLPLLSKKLSADTRETSPFWIKFLDAPNFMNLWKAPQKTHHRERKKFDKIVIPYYWRICRYHNISETKRSSYEIFQYCETKSSTKLWNRYFPNDFWFQNFSERFWKHRRVCARCFSAIWDKQFPTEKGDTPLIIHNFFHTRKFLKHKRVPHEVSWYCETNYFPRKIVKLPDYALNFWVP